MDFLDWQQHLKPIWAFELNLFYPSPLKSGIQEIELRYWQFKSWSNEPPKINARLRLSGMVDQWLKSGQLEKLVKVTLEPTETPLFEGWIQQIQIANAFASIDQDDCPHHLPCVSIEFYKCQTLFQSLAYSEQILKSSDFQLFLKALFQPFHQDQRWLDSDNMF